MKSSKNIVESSLKGSDWRVKEKMNSVTITNKYGLEVNIEVGKYYYVDADPRTKYGSGIILVKRVGESNVRFEAISARMPNEPGANKEFRFDIGSIYATWIIEEDTTFTAGENEITLSFDNLMSGAK